MSEKIKPKKNSSALKFTLKNEVPTTEQNHINPENAVIERIDKIIANPDFKVKELKDATDLLKKIGEIPEFVNNAHKCVISPKLFPCQEKFVESKARFTAFIGGVRSGKTFSGALKGLKRALLLPTTGAAVAPTTGMARDVLVPQYAELAEGRIAKWNASIGDMLLDNGSKILFRSADNPDRLMGLTLDWFHLDEAAQLPKRVWEVLVARTISTGGPGFLSTTPRGKNWVWNLVQSWAGDADAEFFTAKTSENPLINNVEIERARRQMDSRYFRQQFEASFEDDGFCVYEDFSPQINILGKHWQIKNDWPVFIGIDFGWTHPSAVIWAQLSPKGRWVIFDELVEQHLRLESIAAAIIGDAVPLPGRSFQARVPYSRVERIISGAEGLQSRQEAGGESSLSSITGMGITRTAVVRSPILQGVNAVRAKLLSASGQVDLEIDPRCKRLIDDFQSYTYPMDKNGKPIGELPLKDNVHDHTMDALRYMIDFVTPLKTAEWRFG
ncbi:terminase family protein [bacterium]|nr:terminase family protein [bacterium]